MKKLLTDIVKSVEYKSKKVVIKDLTDVEDISEKCDTKECQDLSDVKADGYILEKEDTKVLKI